MNFFHVMNIFDVGAKKPASINTYTDLNEKIELITKWIFLYVVDVTVCSVAILALCACYVSYYIFDMKEESFILPVMMSYVIFREFLRIHANFYNYFFYFLKVGSGLENAYRLFSHYTLLVCWISPSCFVHLSNIVLLCRFMCSNYYHRQGYCNRSQPFEC